MNLVVWMVSIHLFNSCLLHPPKQNRSKWINQLTAATVCQFSSRFLSLLFMIFPLYYRDVAKAVALPPHRDFSCFFHHHHLTFSLIPPLVLLTHLISSPGIAFSFPLPLFFSLAANFASESGCHCLTACCLS